MPASLIFVIAFSLCECIGLAFLSPAFAILPLIYCAVLFRRESLRKVSLGFAIADSLISCSQASISIVGFLGTNNPKLGLLAALQLTVTVCLWIVASILRSDDTKRWVKDGDPELRLINSIAEG